MTTNIVVAAFGGSRVARTRPLYQWDYGQVLQFSGIDLPDAYTVHFSNVGVGGEAKTMVGNADGVTIPDEYLTTGQTVYAWVYLHAGESDGETVYSVIIPVVARPQPTEDEPTPVQQGVIDQAISALNAGVQAAQEAAESVQDMGVEAETLAPGSEATVEKSVDEDGVVTLTFGIPRGDKGEQGEQDIRVSSLTQTGLAYGTVVEAVGIPVYVSDVTQYSAYGLTDTGWYVFARITAKGDTLVTAETTVTGAAGAIITPGADHVDVAVRFGVEAFSQTVVVDWGDYDETFVFKAGDLAVRNLDYRTTFYVYDISDFVTWAYALTTDKTFVADKAYYTKSGDVYTLAEVTAGETVPAETYYNHSKVTFAGMTRNVTYCLDDMIDCPIEIVLPTVAEDGYGAWFEIQLRYNGEYSCTLIPTDASAKIGKTNTQQQKAGINVIDLQYSSVGGAKLWTLLNTHSDIPA